MPRGRAWDPERARAQAQERQRDVERRRQQRPARVPADNVYALLERTSRRESLAARTDTRSCALCGRPLTPDTLTVDHAVARALGGEDHPDNLQATCKRCNNLKSRLEGALRVQQERGVRSPSAVAEALATIPNARERERFAAHPSVRPLLDAITAPEEH